VYGYFVYSFSIYTYIYIHKTLDNKKLEIFSIKRLTINKPLDILESSIDHLITFEEVHKNENE